MDGGEGAWGLVRAVQQMPEPDRTRQDQTGPDRRATVAGVRVLSGVSHSARARVDAGTRDAVATRSGSGRPCACECE